MQQESTLSNDNGIKYRTGESRTQGQSTHNVTDEYEKMMSNIQEIVDNNNAYIFRECIQRNIVLVGRTRTGKSTISKVLQHPLYIPDVGRLYAETRKVSFNQIATLHEKKACYFNIIDSPGLYDITLNVGERLINENIRTFITNCITKDVTHIHVFAFVFSSNGGINIEDIKSMIFIKNKYPQLKESFVLLITQCEEKNVEERDIFVEEFFKHPTVVEIGLRDFFGLGIFFTGCLRPQLKRDPNTMAASMQIKNILKMRQTLLDFLITRENTFNIHYPSVQQPTSDLGTTQIADSTPTLSRTSTLPNIVHFLLGILIVCIAITAIFGKK